MYVKSLEIENLRCFAKTSAKLQYPGLPAGNVNLLLGNNAAGKTTALKALALASLAPSISQSSGFLPYHLVRLGASSARVAAKLVLHHQDAKSIARKSEREVETELTIRRVGQQELLQAVVPHEPLFAQMFETETQAFFVVGYGATRRVEESSSYSPGDQLKRRGLRYLRVASLFEAHLGLTPLTSWLPPLEKENPGRFKQIIHLIAKLLPAGAEFTGKRYKPAARSKERGDYLFSVDGVEAPFGALSDGYRAYIGWISDLLYHVLTGCPSGAKLVESRGLVLVDEVDLHLHPSWQRSVIPTISAALPNLQFVFTTHSPLVASSLHSQNIFVMDGGGIRQYNERIYGLDSEQALLSSYFNLSTTRPAGFVDELRELSKKSAAGDATAARHILLKMAGLPLDDEGPSGGPRKRRAAKP